MTARGQGVQVGARRVGAVQRGCGGERRVAAAHEVKVLAAGDDARRQPGAWAQHQQRRGRREQLLGRRRDRRHSAELVQQDPTGECVDHLDMRVAAKSGIGERAGQRAGHPGGGRHRSVGRRGRQAQAPGPLRAAAGEGRGGLGASVSAAVVNTRRVAASAIRGRRRRSVRTYGRLGVGSPLRAHLSVAPASMFLPVSPPAQ